MARLFETEHFILESYEKPFVDYEDGGTLRIIVKEEYQDFLIDRTKLSAKQATEYIRLSMMSGEALSTVMNRQGIPVIRINYHEMGNRYAKSKEGKPFLHEYIFGRAENAKYQPRPESVYLPDRKTGFYDHFRPLPDDYVEAMRAEMQQLASQEKYKNTTRGLG